MKWLPIALLAVAAAAGAEDDWVEFATTSDGDTHYYARDKLHFDRQGVALWRRVDFRMPLPVRSALAQSGRYREHIDCADRRLRTLGYLYYAADGSVIENVYTPDAPSVAIRKDTPAERLAESLCPVASEQSAQMDAPQDDDLERLRREVEALQSQVRQMRRSLEVQEAAGAGQ